MHRDHHEDQELEALLRRTRPVASDAFVQATERELLGRPPRRRVGRARSLLAALAAGTAVVAAVVVATVADTDDEAARATPACRDVRVTKNVRQGEIVAAADGTPRVVYRVRPVTTTVKRCR
ncbi:hypothetical protein [Paraconexibacter sp.]|uniref:hypothetical protein n=1 Tax=Paraconexibacter sp. TaxID=2949640 RepID=UPI0035689D39